MSDEAPDPRYLLKVARESLTAFDRRKKYRARDFLDERYWNRAQLAFFEGGASGVHQRALIGGNQGGKSTACAFEESLHLDGCYPQWWKGLRVTEPQNYWAIGVTAASTKKTLQGLLCGRQEFGTGMIPLESFAKKPIMIPGGTGAIETAFVTWHDANGNPAGISTISSHSYDQQRSRLQSETVKMSWWDEHCPEDIYMELLARGAAREGHLIGSFTPAGPEGALGITQRFLAEPSPDRKIYFIRSADITHISAERLDQLGAEYGDEAETRLEGTPRLGMGPMFPTELLPSLTKNISDAIIPDYAKRIIGFDFGGFGGGHPAAGVYIAWDYKADRVYVLNSFRMKQGDVRKHVGAFDAMTKGLRVRVAWPHDGGKKESDGKSLAWKYEHEGGALMLPSHAINPGTENFSIEPGLTEIRERMIAGTLIIHACNVELIEELRGIHRDESGKVVKLNDDLTSALRYALMMKKHGKPEAEYAGIGWGTLPLAYQKPARDTDPSRRFARGSANHPDGAYDLWTLKKRTG